MQARNQQTGAIVYLPVDKPGERKQQIIGRLCDIENEMLGLQIAIEEATAEMATLPQEEHPEEGPDAESTPPGAD